MLYLRVDVCIRINIFIHYDSENAYLSEIRSYKLQHPEINRL